MAETHFSPLFALLLVTSSLYPSLIFSLYMHVWFDSSYYSNIYKEPLDVQGYWQGASLAADPLQITVSNKQVLGMACIIAEKLHSLRLGVEIKGLKGINFCYFTGKLTEAGKHTDMVKKQKHVDLSHIPIPVIWDLQKDKKWRDKGEEWGSQSHRDQAHLWNHSQLLLIYTRCHFEKSRLIFRNLGYHGKINVK